MVFMTFHYAEAAVNLLTIDAVDPTAKIPEYKVCAVAIERVKLGESEILASPISNLPISSQ
jgi:predicted molibdopterin-dependent oxidoreductase YjgC